MKKKLIIGLTGGFGSGKSEIAKIFAHFGACVLDADKIAHQALKKGSPVFGKIKALFPEALSRCGRYFYRRKIAETIFKNPDKRERLEALVHPYVYKKIEQKAVRSKKRVVIVEIPLLFEAGFEGLCNRTVAVTCRPTVKTVRLLKKGFLRTEIKAREKVQMRESLKAKRADFVIDNSSSISKTKERAVCLWKRFGHLLKGE